MHVSVDQRIFEAFPGFRLGLIYVDGVSCHSTCEPIDELAAATHRLVCDKLAHTKLADHPHIAPWHDAYKQFGAKPKKYPSSLESLVKRTCSGKGGSAEHPLVTLYNTMSLRHMLPMGAHDCDALVDGVSLGYATGDENPVIVLGEDAPKVPKQGEVVYKDGAGVACRRWNWREVSRVCVTPQTQRAVIYFEALPVVDDTLLHAAMFECASYITNVLGFQARGLTLDAHSPACDLAVEGMPMHAPQASIDPEDVVSGEYFRQMHLTQQAREHARSEHRQRVTKVRELEKEGESAWKPARDVSAMTNDVKALQAAGASDREVSISGRVMTMREHGRAIFCDVQDMSGRLQIYVRKDVVGEETFAHFHSMCDTGDIIWCAGTPFVTKTGEVTLRVTDVSLMTKCLHPMPEKFHGLVDQETKYRQRYLDLMTNRDTMERFKQRSAIIRTMRSLLDDDGYMEVETPMLHPIPGGAAARPFVTHHNALDMDLFLRIAPELYLKRLMVGGIERLYEINRNFRNEGISTRHNPEFTMLEFYTAHRTYTEIMDYVTQLLQSVVQHVYGSLLVTFGEHTIDFSTFRRLSPYEAICQLTEIDEQDLAPEAIDRTCAYHGVSIEASMSYYQKVFAVFEACAEPQIVQPTFIVDFPIEISPLAQRDPEREGVAARFELFIAGMEISNGFNELNDPFDQAQRFKEQAEAHASGDDEAMRYDQDYITALEYGMPPAVGVGIGIDRLVMLCTNTQSIKECILFPTLKRHDG